MMALCTSAREAFLLWPLLATCWYLRAKPQTQEPPASIEIFAAADSYKGKNLPLQKRVCAHLADLPGRPTLLGLVPKKKQSQKFIQPTVIFLN